MCAQGKAIHETDRLIIREMTRADAPFLLRLLNEPGWIEHIGDRGVRTETDAVRYAEDGPMRSYAEHGFGLCLVIEKQTGDPVGICGLVVRAGLDAPDLGFAFLAAASGRGLATEAGRVVLDHAHAERGFPSILAITSPGNAASIRVLEKLGFTGAGSVRLSEDAAPSSLFEHRSFC